MIFHDLKIEPIKIFKTKRYPTEISKWGACPVMWALGNNIEYLNIKHTLMASTHVHIINGINRLVTYDMS